MKLHQSMFLAVLILSAPRMNDTVALFVAIIALVLGIIAGANDK